MGVLALVPSLAVPPAVTPAVTNGEVILYVVIAAIPIAAITFILGSGKAFREIGKGQFGVDFESDAPKRLRDSDAEATPEVREEEIRQLLEAKAYRQQQRGEETVDVDGELERLLAESEAGPGTDDPALREEVRQLVIARNERRARRGEAPLDVEEEIARQLRELEDLDG